MKLIIQYPLKIYLHKALSMWGGRGSAGVGSGRGLGRWGLKINRNKFILKKNSKNFGVKTYILIDALIKGKSIYKKSFFKQTLINIFINYD